MLMNTQHMVEFTVYEFTPVGGRVCKETDPAVGKVPWQDRRGRKNSTFLLALTLTFTFKRLHYHCTPLTR